MAKTQDSWPDVDNRSWERAWFAVGRKKKIDILEEIANDRCQKWKAHCLSISNTVRKMTPTAPGLITAEDGKSVDSLSNKQFRKTFEWRKLKIEILKFTQEVKMRSDRFLFHGRQL